MRKNVTIIVIVTIFFPLIAAVLIYLDLIEKLAEIISLAQILITLLALLVAFEASILLRYNIIPRLRTMEKHIADRVEYVNHAALMYGSGKKIYSIQE